MKIFGYYVGSVEALIAVNVLVFLANALSLNYLIESFSLSRSTVAAAPWTLVTSMFLHAGFAHLALNMISLFFFGGYLGHIAGERDLLKIYFAGGIAGGIFFVLTSSPLSYAVGASGAIFALGAALAVLRPHIKVIMIPIPIPMPLWIAVFGLLVVMSFPQYIPILPLFFPGLAETNIAWQGHMGGLAVGAVCGWFLRKKYSVQVYDYYR